MGLFCLSTIKPPEAVLDAALGNLELYNEYLQSDKPLNYLLGLIENQIKEAIGLITEQAALNKQPNQL